MTRALLYDRSCRCQRCKQGLRGIPTAIKRCPRCRARLEPAQVWSRRKYPGLIEVPTWMIPCLIVLALALIALPFLTFERNDIAANLVSVVVVGFFALPWLAFAYSRWVAKRPQHANA